MQPAHCNLFRFPVMGPRVTKGSGLSAGPQLSESLLLQTSWEVMMMGWRGCDPFFPVTALHAQRADHTMENAYFLLLQGYIAPGMQIFQIQRNQMLKQSHIYSPPPPTNEQLQNKSRLICPMWIKADHLSLLRELYIHVNSSGSFYSDSASSKDWVICRIGTSF